MANRREVAVNMPEPEELTIQDLMPLEDETDDSFLLSCLSQIGEDDDKAKVIAYRVVDGKNDAMLKRFDPADFARSGFDDLLNQYGGGTYRIRVYDQNSRLIGNRKITIEEPKNFKPPVEEKRDSNQEVIMAMQQGFEKMASMFANALQNVAPKNESRLDFLKEMVTMRELFAPSVAPAPASNDVESTMSLFFKGLEFGKSLNPSEPSEKGLLLEAVRELAPVLMAHTMPSSTVNEQQVQPVMLPNNQMPQSAPAQISEQGADVNFFIKQAVSFLKQQAEKDADPSTYANMVLDNLSEQDAKALVQMPDWLDRLEAISPGVKLYQPWFEELKKEVLDILTSQDETGINQNHADQQHPPG